LFEWTAQIERLSLRRIVAVGLCSAIAALLGTLPAEGIADSVLIAAALGSSVLTALAAQERRRISGLPLVLAERAVRGMVVGQPVCGFRAWLGRGRVVRSPEIEVAFRTSDGVEQPLDAILPTDVLWGPWTFQVPDPGLAGRFVVRVAVREGDRDWEVRGEWDRDLLAEGRFSSPVSRTGGRLRWHREAWDRVECAER